MSLKKIFTLPISLSGGIKTGTIYTVGIMIVLVGFGSVLTRGVVPPTAQPMGTAVTIVPPQIESGKKNLQLFTFGYTTPAPTPTSGPTIPPTPTTPPHCPLESIKTPGCGACFPEFEMVACDEKPCVSPGRDMSGRTIFDPQYATYNCGYKESTDPALFQKKLAQPNCRGACVAKPIIYLYPIAQTMVDVKITIPGKVIISDPLYPDDGWKNVLASPNGTLLYKNNKYHELFYESDVDKVNAPDDGIVIAKSDLKDKLTEATTKLGLNKFEQKEFLEYWIPELNKLNSPYILFSVIDPMEKERIDHVDISPIPDTFIGFLAYFKPQDSPETDLMPLVLPENPPNRTGFTAVEWGGTIDLN